eukprot:gene6434-8192_t
MVPTSRGSRSVLFHISDGKCVSNRRSEMVPTTMQLQSASSPYSSTPNVIPDDSSERQKKGVIEAI